LTLIYRPKEVLADGSKVIVEKHEI